MDNAFIAQITNGRIERVESGRNGSFVIISGGKCTNCNNTNDTIRLNVGENTLILNENGNKIPITDLRTNMTVNAAFSLATTRSIPPQAAAYIIQVVQQRTNDEITIGRIVNINRQNRSFTTISDGNLSTVIQFNVPEDAVIRNVFGRPMNFSSLVPGLRVRVRHASFMTASIPPQTTAFEIRVIG